MTISGALKTGQKGAPKTGKKTASFLGPKRGVFGGCGNCIINRLQKSRINPVNPVSTFKHGRVRAYIPEVFIKIYTQLYGIYGIYTGFSPQPKGALRMISICKESFATGFTGFFPVNSFPFLCERLAVTRKKSRKSRTHKRVYNYL